MVKKNHMWQHAASVTELQRKKMTKRQKEMNRLIETLAINQI